MTISTLIRKTIAAGDGVTTAFNFAFQVRSAADLQVYFTDAAGTQTLLAPAAYGVVLNPVPSGQLWSNGGTVSYPLSGAAIAAGTKLTIVRSVDLLQSSSLINQGGYYADVVEAALDVLTMEVQQISETIARALTLPISSSATTALPNPIANAAIGWDPTGTFITNILQAGVIAIPVSIAQGGTGVITAAAMGRINWAIATGTADVITAAYTPANAALTDGMILCFRSKLPNATTTPTFSPDGLAAHTIVKAGGNAVSTGDIPGALAECFVRYNLANTRWELLNPGWPLFSPLNAALGADVALNNTANYFDTVSVAQGTVGKFLCFATVTVTDTGGAANIRARLWDGTNIVCETSTSVAAGSFNQSFSMAAIITSPVANIKVSVKDTTANTGKVLFNTTGDSIDTTLTVIRIG